MVKGTNVAKIQSHTGGEFGSLSSADYVTYLEEGDEVYVKTGAGTADGSLGERGYHTAFMGFKIKWSRKVYISHEFSLIW